MSSNLPSVGSDSTRSAALDFPVAATHDTGPARSLKRLAIVHPWPGMKNSELDLMQRIKTVGKRFGVDVEFVTPTGQLLDEKGRYLLPHVLIGSEAFPDVDAVLYLHYLVPRLIDAFGFLTNWNPIPFLLKDPASKEDNSPQHLKLIRTALQSQDCILSAGSQKVDAFAKCFTAIPGQPYLMAWGTLHTTCQVFEGLPEPALNDFSVFYVAANWERLKGKDRHGSLTERLDESGKFSFYGLRHQAGVFLWEGYKNYKGELPFDGGESIVRTSNQCGVTLVLHSIDHASDALVSTRIFQACAAKTVIITGENPWVLENFGDSVIIIHQDYDDPEKTARNILDAVTWIEQHPGEALEKSRRAHRIFRERFSLDAEFHNLIASFPQLMQSKYRLPQETSNQIDVLWRYEMYSSFDFARDMKKQVGVMPRAVVYANRMNKERAARFLTESGLPYMLVVSERPKTLGEMFLESIRRPDAGRAVAIYQRHTRWQRDHLCSLLQLLDQDSPIVQSATFVFNNVSRETTYPDYYKLCGDALDGYAKPVSLADVVSFNTAKFMPSAFLIDVAASRSMGSELDCISQFDPGFIMYWIAAHLHGGGDLPRYTGKLTNVFSRIGDVWHIDNYYDALVSRKLEHGLYETLATSSWLQRDLPLINSLRDATSNGDYRASAPARLQNEQTPLLTFPIRRQQPKSPLGWYRLKRMEHRAYHVIKEAKVFDEQFYCRQIPENEKPIDPLIHFIRVGVWEGLNPCHGFDTKYYLQQNADVLNARTNPLMHFLEYGVHELRRPSPELDVLATMSSAPTGETKALHAYICSATRIRRR